MFGRLLVPGSPSAVSSVELDSSSAKSTSSRKCSQWSRRKKMIVTGATLCVLSVVVIISLVVISKAHENSTDSEVPINISFETASVELNAGGLYNLDRSRINQSLILLKKTSAGRDGVYHDTPAARSYDGNTWEPIFPLNQRIEQCTSARCVIRLPNDGAKYIVLRRDALARSDEQIISDFLIQSTFGPTRDLIKSFPRGSSFKDRVKTFIRNQMEADPTLHRVYYRQRANPIVPSVSQTGGIRGPCEIGSRWERAAIDMYDSQQTLTINGNQLFINGQLRTEVRPSVITALSLAGPGPWKLCDMSSPHAAANFLINFRALTSSNCDNHSWRIPNPIINFTTSRPSQVIHTNVHFRELTPSISRTVLLASTSAACRVTSQNSGTMFAQDTRGTWYRFSRRLKLVENTVANPYDEDKIFPRPQWNPNVVKTFQNEEECQLTYSEPPVQYVSKTFFLNQSVLTSFFALSEMYVYYITGLTPSSGPCSKNTARFRRGTRTCPNPGVTSAAIRSYLSSQIRSADTSGLIVIDVTTGSRCAGIGPGFQILVDQTCWIHVHDDLYNVYDFTQWAYAHPGGKEMIQQFARNGIVQLTFPPPSSHPINRWETNHVNFPYLGIFGEKVDFVDLPVNVQQIEIAEYLGAVKLSTNLTVTERCGSPGEVANDPSKGNRFYMNYNFQLFNGPLPPIDVTFLHYNLITQAKYYVWANSVLSAEDQLRQMVAWALAQIWVVSDKFVDELQTEMWTNYYDIFVRNAFGNYFDVMKEVSYSPMMGNMLSFVGGTSYQKSKNFPDENYAREIMQLFSIGLWKLNMNGTKIAGPDGRVLETYTNADIQSFARVWTGFRTQQARGNMEAYNNSFGNMIDPLFIDADAHDTFSKQGLDGDHIGDGYPLCRTLPPRSFLRIGAKYRFLGSMNRPVVYASTRPSRLTLDENSNLHKELCDPAQDGSCQLKSVVYLKKTLTCFGIECGVDTVRMVSIKVSKTDFVNYEFVEFPCVELEFPELGRVTTNNFRNNPLCVDHRSARAAPVCCSGTEAVLSVSYTGEVTTFGTASSRCATSRRSLCSQGIPNPFGTNTRLWSVDACKMNAQVFSDGRVSLVQQTEASWGGSGFYGLSKDSNIKLRVNWARNTFPKTSNRCDNICEVSGDSCICPTSAVTRIVFQDSKKIPTLLDISSKLFIGAPDPLSFDAGTYIRFFRSSDSNIEVYVDSSRTFNERTIFVLKSTGSRVRFLANIRADVRIGTYSFRNPPNFMKHDEPNSKDASYEIDAVLKHLLYNSNTAVFIGSFLIKRFVTSNPSPSYQEAVANAFATGSFEGFGTGQYGDLAATVAAVLLYRDGLSMTLKVDSSHGKFREPIVKLMHSMRALDSVSAQNREYDLQGLESWFAEEPHSAPTVFNFYQSEYQPEGAVTNTGLVAPESQLLTTPRILGFFNGLLTLVEMGLTNCATTSFGIGLYNPQSCYNIRVGTEDPIPKSSGYLNYSASTNGLDDSAVLKHLDLLLTAGRLDLSRKDLLNSLYRSISRTSKSEATKSAIEFILASPEFHVTSAALSSGRKRPQMKAPNLVFTPSEYKAIVYVFLEGGMDSYNLLVPHTCSPRDLYQQYSEIRTNAAIPKEQLLRINSSQSPRTQPCQVFGVHPKMPNLRALYNSGEAAFVSNIGTLVEKISVADFVKGIKKIPVGLFAHNVQQTLIRNLKSDDMTAKGVLGRIQDSFTRRNRASASYSVTGSFALALEGSPGVSEAQNIIDPQNGIITLDQDNLNPALRNYVFNSTIDVSESIMADNWNQILKDGMEKPGSLKSILETANMPANFGKYQDSFANQLAHVSRVIASRATLKHSANMFYVSMGGFDTHNSFSIFGDNMARVDSQLQEFVTELKRQGVWNQVAIVVASDFGRTMGSNGRGTDHAWAGNTFILGGSVKGGRIFGKYPSNLAEGGEVNINGRLIPTLPWEAIWNAVAQWFGVAAADLDTVLPNRKNFGSDYLLQKADLFKN